MIIISPQWFGDIIPVALTFIVAYRKSLVNQIFYLFLSNKLFLVAFELSLSLIDHTSTVIYLDVALFLFILLNDWNALLIYIGIFYFGKLRSIYHCHSRHFLLWEVLLSTCWSHLIVTQ